MAKKKIVVGLPCVNCGVCKDWCMAQAIVQGADWVSIDQTKCTQCLRCIPQCPAECIYIEFE